MTSGESLKRRIGYAIQSIEVTWFLLNVTSSYSARLVPWMALPVIWL